MSSSVRVVPWLTGACSMYAVVRDGVCLPDEFIDELASFNLGYAEQLTNTMSFWIESQGIRQAQLRPERPELGVFAVYDHKETPGYGYNPARLLCTFVGESNRILLLGAGFIKTRDEPIQLNARANAEAVFLAGISKELISRISLGEISITESELVPSFHDSMCF